MTKIFLLIALLFQLTFVFGQTPIAEDEKVIQYNTKWGEWISAAGNPSILFSAKLNSYDKKKKLYSWSVRRKVLKMPIAFEWKISNQVFTSASDTPEENDGYYTSSVFDSKDNTNSMNSSGFPVYSTSKTTLYYQVRNVCYDFDGRNPNCEQTAGNNKAVSNSNESIYKEKIAQLFKESLTGNTYEYGKLSRQYSVLNFSVTDESINFTQHEVHNAYSDNSTMDVDYSIPFSKLYLMSKEEYTDYNSNVQSLVFPYDKDIKIVRHQRIFTKGYYSTEYGNKSFNFYFNLKNYDNLKNAIEALKNPNKSFGGSSKQSSNVEKTEIIKSNTTENNPLSEEKRIEEINRNYELGTNAYNEHNFNDAEVYYQKVLDFNPNDKNSYSNLIAVKFELEREIVELANKNLSNVSIYNKYLEKRVKLLMESKTLIESYLLLDDKNQDFKDSLEKINKILLDNEKTNQSQNLITEQQLLKMLKNKTANKLEIFKKYFIQEGYEFIGNGQCKSFFDGVLKCLKFSGFSIYQNKKGMVGISFGENSILMKEIKNKLIAINSSFIENELHDGEKIVECDITFNQGELLFYMK